jgi:3'(2'), 5'-bisphosphate nucleotidase
MNRRAPSDSSLRTPITEKRIMNLNDLTAALSEQMPSVMRWGGAVAKQLRRFDISVTGKKTSGSANTDALTLADLSVQELLVAALRDGSPLFRQCRIEAEESTGALDAFATDAEYTLALDPIDGTKQYRDKSGDGWAVMLHLRSCETVHYSLVYIPEAGPHGTWVEAVGGAGGGVVKCGPDDPTRPAAEVLRSIPPIDPAKRPESKKIYLIGFQSADPAKARAVTEAGLHGHTAEQMPGCIFDLLARGEFGGSLIHTPNVYDFPVSLHIARILGGESVRVDTGEPSHFGELWTDDRADMLRMQGIHACAVNRETLDTLVQLAKDWDPVRYRD